MKNKKAFTLIELLVVIAIIGLLATLSVLALNNARAKSRDAKRVADIKQMQTALELYFNDKQSYPTSSEMVSSISSYDPTSGTSTYMQVIPTSPNPQATACTGAGGDVYTYTQDSAGASYSLNYCLEGNVGTISGGELHTATNAALY